MNTTRRRGNRGATPTRGTAWYRRARAAYADYSATDFASTATKSVGLFIGPLEINVTGVPVTTGLSQTKAERAIGTALASGSATIILRGHVAGSRYVDFASTQVTLKFAEHWRDGVVPTGEPLTAGEDYNVTLEVAVAGHDAVLDSEGVHMDASAFMSARDVAYASLG